MAGLTVFVRALDGAVHAVELDPAATVPDLRRELPDCIPAKAPLLWQGQELDPEAALADLGISNEAVICCGTALPWLHELPPAERELGTHLLQLFCCRRPGEYQGMTNTLVAFRFLGLSDSEERCPDSHPTVMVSFQVAKQDDGTAVTGDTPAHMLLRVPRQCRPPSAYRSMNLRMLELLLRAPGVAMHANGEGDTVLHLLCGADAVGGLQGAPWLSFANQNGRQLLDTVRLVLGLDTDPAALNLRGRSALELLLMGPCDYRTHDYDQPEWIEVLKLVAVPAVVNLKWNGGETALHRVASLGNGAGIAAIVAAGGNPCARDAEGWLPLHCFLLNGIKRIQGPDWNRRRWTTPSPALGQCVNHEPLAKLRVPIEVAEQQCGPIPLLCVRYGNYHAARLWLTYIGHPELPTLEHVRREYTLVCQPRECPFDRPSPPAGWSAAAAGDAPRRGLEPFRQRRAMLLSQLQVAERKVMLAERRRRPRRRGYRPY